MQVCIVDFDVHHGNGTQDIFYDDPSVLFVDIHQDGVWPKSGQRNETGIGAGVNTTINIPLPGGFVISSRNLARCSNSVLERASKPYPGPFTMFSCSQILVPHLPSTGAHNQSLVSTRA